MTNKILFYEELSLNAFPSLQTCFYDGWALRFANGYFNRANSICPFYPSELDINEKIDECEKIYASRGLPCVFKMVDGLCPPPLETELKKRGYEIVTPTDVLVSDISGKNFEPGDCVFSGRADEAWLDSYFALHKTSGGLKKETVRRILENITHKTVYGRIEKNGATVACGTAVIERGHAQTLNVIVGEKFRGEGYGKQICSSLLYAAKQHGARIAYLQAVCDNAPAQNLYKKMGYEKIYSYRYRLKNISGG